jgi:DNA-binding transcriptional ArsR family regulator
MVDNRLDVTFHALADPTRRGMLASLALGEKSIGELAEPFSMTLAGASKHVKVLEGAGLLGEVLERPPRPTGSADRIRQTQGEER